MNRVYLQYAQFILILPVVFRWLSTAGNPLPLILISLLLMGVAEFIRQFLSVRDGSSKFKPVQVFFFGLIYKDQRDSFLQMRSSSGANEATDWKKNIVFTAIYVITLFVVRINTQFAALGFLESGLFVLLVSLWTACKTYRKLNTLLLLNFVITAIGFLNSEENHSIGFYVWLFTAALVQFYIDRLRHSEAAALPPDSQPSFEWPIVAKILLGALTLSLIYKAVDFAVPQYKEESLMDSSTSANEQILAPQNRAPVKNPNLPISPSLIHSMAKFNLQTKDIKPKDLLQLQRLTSKNRIPLRNRGTMNSFENNEAKLQSLRESLAKGENLTSEQIQMYRDLLKKIRIESGGSKTANKDAEIAESSDADQQLLQKLNKPATTDPKLKGSDDDVADYLRARKKLADEIDSLSELNGNNAVITEEERLKRKIETFFKSSRKFVIYILPIFLLLYLATRRREKKNSEETQEVKSLTLSKKVRVQLRHLYDLLTKTKLSPRDEVLKSYYILELAFKEIDFGRTEDLPPSTYRHKLETELPFISDAVSAPISLFNRVFYGERNPEEQEIKELRLSMKKLMKKLQVI